MIQIVFLAGQYPDHEHSGCSGLQCGCISCKFPVGALHPFTSPLATGLVSRTLLFVSQSLYLQQSHM